MFRRFRDKRVEKFIEGQRVAKFQAFERTLERRLRVLEVAKTLQDIGSVPGHHLEPLQGDRAGEHSIKINDQYRICFVWHETMGAMEIEVTDYH